MRRTIRAIYATTSLIARHGMLLFIAVFTVMPTQGEEVFFDNYQQFTSGTVLTTTNYIPLSSPSGTSAKFQINAGSSQVIATNFHGGIWAFADEKIGGNNKFQGTFPSTLYNKVVDISWAMLTQGTNSGTGGCLLNILVSVSTNGDIMYNPLLFLNDNGQIGVSTNNPPSLPLLTVGNWGQYVGTVMTNRLKLDYPAGLFTFSINGLTVTNMPIPSCFTNVLDAVRLQFYEAFPDSLGNRFLWDDVLASVQDYNYTNINGTITITGYTGSIGNMTITNIIDGLPVTRIGDSAFYTADILTNVTIPSSVKDIGNSAFEFCFNLTGITIPNSITNIGASAFWNDSGLTSVMIPRSVSNIGGLAFSYCYKLTNFVVDLSNSFYSSRDGNLFNKSQSELINSHNNIAGNYAIPRSVTLIDDFAFSPSMSLTSVTIPSRITSIGQNAFFHCINLTGVYFQGDVPLNDISMFGGDNLTVYYYPWTSGWTDTYGGHPAQVNTAYTQWLTNYGFTTNLTEDNDHDGMKNWQEYLAGTNPTNKADKLTITSMIRTNTAKVSWLAKSNISYQVRKSPDLKEAWANASSGIGTNQQSFQTASADGILQYADPDYAATTSAFYRVNVVP